METAGKRHISHYKRVMIKSTADGFLEILEETTRQHRELSTAIHMFVPPACFATTAVDVTVTLTNAAIAARRQTIPTSPRVKKPKVWKRFRRRPFQMETDLYMAMLAVCCYTADKLRTDVFGVIFTLPLLLLPHDPLSYPPPPLQFP